MKKLLLFLSTLILLSGCGTSLSNSEKADKYLVSEFPQYKQVKTKFSVTESEIMNKYNNSIGKKWTSDENLVSVLDEIIPKAEQYLTEVNSIKIKSSTIKNLHSFYVDGYSLCIKSWIMMREALINQDKAKMDAANSLMREGNALTRKWLKEYTVLSLKLLGKK